MAPAAPAPFQDLACLQKRDLGCKELKKEPATFRSGNSSRRRPDATIGLGILSLKMRRTDKDLEAVISVAEGSVKYVVFEFDSECANPIRLRRPLFPVLDMTVGDPKSAGTI